MAVDLTNKIHGDFSTGSGVWIGYRGDVTGAYITEEGTGVNYAIYSNKLIREYNEKISELNQPSDLYIEPYDAGFRYVNNPLLAQYTGAIGAYSTRTVGFGGPLMRIRRSSDNTEVDVRGDIEGNLSLSSPLIATGTDATSGSLGAFIGATHTGHCSVWYDQSTTGSNRINAVQTTASRQPILVDGGELVTSNNDKAALKFLGHSTLLTLEAGFNASGDFYWVHETDKTEANWTYPISLESTTTVNYGPYCVSGSNEVPYDDYGLPEFKVYGNDNLINTGTLASQAFFSGLSGKMLGSHINATTQGWANWRFGRGLDVFATSLDFAGKTQEWVFYPSGSAQTGIQNNINNHFKIY